jgi:flavin-dependent dehydrogenase
VARFDVLVVGAGPAGSTAARECADRGLSTALLDRAEFPRDKPCGGGVTARAAALLPLAKLGAALVVLRPGFRKAR